MRMVYYSVSDTGTLGKKVCLCHLLNNRSFSSTKLFASLLFRVVGLFREAELAVEFCQVFCPFKRTDLHEKCKPLHCLSSVKMPTKK